MKVRYGDCIVTVKSPDIGHCRGFVPPAVLQLLVENAIKHNSFSHERPLEIEVFMSPDGYLTVRNNRSPLSSEIESTGLGLKNITQRYSLMCSRKVVIEDSEDHYSVSLPIIRQATSHEDIDSRR